MENGPPMKTEAEPAKPADTSGDSVKLQGSESMPLGASKSSPKPTNATTPKGSKKTLKNVALAGLRSKAGLVAGALADFQGAKGIIVREEIAYTAPSGRVCKAIKLILLVEDADLVAVVTKDGLEFDLVADEEKVTK